MSKLKTAFSKARSISPLYTGGPAAVSTDATFLVTCVGDEAVLTRLRDGQIISRFACDDETIHSLCITPSSSHLVIFTASMSMFIFENPCANTESETPVKPTRVIPRAHDAPVHVCKFDPTSTLLASGSADGVVKVWDVRRGYVTHAFKGHGGVVSALVFRYLHDTSSVVPTEPSLHLITGSVDTRLRIFDLSPSVSRTGSNKAIAVLEGHMSVPRGLDVSEDGKTLISGGRDAVVLVWDLLSVCNTASNHKKKAVPALVKTITALERVEAIGFVSGYTESSSNSSTFFTGGEKGVVKLWDLQSGKCIFAFDSSENDAHEQAEEEREILNAAFIPSTKMVMSVHADQNILFYSVPSRTLSRQVIGYNDEIIDSVFLSSNDIDTHIAVAANSSLIRVYSIAEYDARLLAGHSNIVLCLDRSSSGRYLASGSKDKSARIWSFIDERKEWSCVGVCEGHAESVGAIALSRETSTEGGADQPSLMFTGSQDCTIKLWDLTNLHASSSSVAAVKCKSLSTVKAHEKDINALDVSPNNLYLASASQDRTAKVYEIQFSSSSAGSKGELKLLGVCKGHKRGVWTVRFGTTERILATGSGDKTIKLWNLDDYSCVKTLESHTNSVLQVRFLNRDTQLASSASDGLLKLWNVRSDECIATMDNHTDKIWALAIGSDESTIVTGGADSVITFWKDCTKELELEKEEKRAQTVQKEQDLLNYLTLQDYARAISLALSMDQPGRLFSIFSTILMDPPEATHGRRQKSFTGSPDVDSVLRDLPLIELATLLQRIRDWNANSKTCSVAQSLLYSVLRLRSSEDIAKALHGAALAPIDVGTAKEKLRTNDIVPSLIPYTERHLTRLDRLIQESYVLDIVLGEMDDGMEIDVF